MAWLTALSLAGMTYAASKQAKAQKAAAAKVEAAARMRAARYDELAAPYLKRLGYALPAMEGLVRRYGSLTEKESPILRGEHEQSLAAIERNRERALASTRLQYGSLTGRGRGEALRAGRVATEMTNRQNLAYGGMQEDYLTQARDRYFGGLGTLTNIGSTGTRLSAQGADIMAGGMTNAATMRADSARDFWGEIGSLAGFGLTSEFYRGIERDRRQAGASGKPREAASAVSGTSRQGSDYNLGVQSGLTQYGGYRKPVRRDYMSLSFP